jgi:hypothetical protein
MTVRAGRQLITDHGGYVSKAHLDRRMPERAEVSAKPFVLLTANHEDFLLAVVGVYKLKDQLCPYY